MKFTISKKLYLFGLVVILGLGILAGNAYFTNMAIQSASSKATERNNELNLLKKFNVTHSNLLLLAMNAIIHREKGKIDEDRLKDIKENIHYIKSNLHQLNNLANTKETKGLISGINKAFPEMVECIQVDLIKLIEQNTLELKKIDERFNKLDDEFDQYGAQIKSGLSDIFKVVQVARNKASSRSLIIDEQMLLINKIIRMHSELILAAKSSMIDKDEGRIDKERMDTINTSVEYITKNLDSIESIIQNSESDDEKEQFEIIKHYFPKLANVIQFDLIQLIKKHADMNEFIQLDDVIEMFRSRIILSLREILAFISRNHNDATLQNEFQNKKYNTLKAIMQSYSSLMLDVMDVVMKKSETIADIEWMEIINKNTIIIKDNLYSLFHMVETENENQALENINYNFQRLSEGIKVELSNLIVSRSFLIEDIDAGFKKINLILDKNGKQIADNFLRLLAIVQKKQKEVTEVSAKRISGATKLGLIAFIITMGFSIPAILIFSRSITLPIIKIVDFAKKISNGDLSETLNIQRNDEIGAMAVALNDMVSAQSKLVNNLQKLPAPVFEIDLDFNVLYINEAGAKMVDLEPEKCIGQKCYDLFKADNCQSDQCASARALKANNQIICETRANPGKLSKIPIMFTAIPIRQQKIISGVLEFIVDQTTIYNIVEEVRKVTAELNMSSKDLSSVAAEVTSSTQDVAQLAKKTAKNVESMTFSGEEISKNVHNEAAVIEELTSSLSEVAKNTTKASRISLEADEMTSEINQRMQALVTASDQIGKVITVIKNIADRTDLLALNAAIEAEGAGVAGKGFAVVADEVKKLAKQSADATDEIANEIDNIQKSTRDAVQVIEKINESLHDIATINKDIASAVDKQSTVAGEISKTIAKTAKGSKRVAKDSNEAYMLVNDIAKYTNEIAISAGHTSDSSQSLSTMASGLMEIVKKFRL